MAFNFYRCIQWELLSFLLLTCISRTGASIQDSRLSRFEIQEEISPGTIVGNVKENAFVIASFDEDVLSKLRFVFRYANHPYLYFSINETTGVIKTSRRINREQLCPNDDDDGNVCTLSLDVTLLPKEYFQIIKVLIDVGDINDNSPIFPQSRIQLEIKENLAPGTLFNLPTADDADSGVNSVREYKFSSTSDMFGLVTQRQVDGSIESVHLNLTSRLDREMHASHTLTVIAVDGGDPARSGSIVVTITVGDANDNNPSFDDSNYEADMPENMPSGKIVIRVHATDPDYGNNGLIGYNFAEFTESTYGRLFGINNTTGEIYIKMALDYEKQSSYQLTVVASDHGVGSLPAYAKVSVNVIDENDNAPQIQLNSLTSNGNVEVRENSSPRTFVAYVAVQDGDSGKNGQVECSMHDELFQLEQFYGSEYKLTTLVTFDREEMSEYTVIMSCNDKAISPKTSSLSITVYILDENDNAPTLFESLTTIEVEEKNDVGQFIATINATDRDSGQNADLFYQLQGSDVASYNMLQIDASTGQIFANEVFDYEKVQDYKFLLTVYDRGSAPLSCTGSVILRVIDINDEIPQFEKSMYHFSTFENGPAGSLVGRIQANDADVNPAFKKIAYSLPFGSSAFEINSTTGSIHSIRKLDREETNSFSFVVAASNEGFPNIRSLVNVTIYVEDINDNSPVIAFPNKENYVVQVASRAPAGTFVTRINAWDPDLGHNALLVYSISNGNEQQVFQIDGKTGAISTAVDIGEGERPYRLVITVKDGGIPEQISAADLIIKVNKTIQPNASPFSEQGASGLVGDKLILLTAFVCGLFIIIVIIILVILFVMHRRRKIAKQKELLRHQSGSQCNSCSNLRREASSNLGSHASRRSLEERQTLKIRCRNSNNEMSGTERDETDDEDDEIMPGILPLRKEIRQVEVCWLGFQSDTNVQYYHNSFDFAQMTQLPSMAISMGNHAMILVYNYIIIWGMPGHIHRRSHCTGCVGPDPTNFWESNMGPAQNCVESINSLQLGPYHLFNPAAPLDIHIHDNMRFYTFLTKIILIGLVHKL